MPETYRYIHPSLPPIPSSSDKLYDVEIKVDDLKRSLASNIESVITRGERLEETERRALALEESSNLFQRSARRLRCEFCKRNAKLICCVSSAFGIAIFTIAMIAKTASQ